MKKLLDRQCLNQTIWNNTYNSLKSLVDNCYYAQITTPPFSEVSDKNYLKEFCTVRMATARASGHSMALIKVALEYFDKVLFLSPTVEMAYRLNQYFVEYCTSGTKGITRIKRRTQNTLETPDGHYHFTSFKSSLSYHRGIEYEAIIVDGAFWLSQKKEDEIYGSFSPAMARYPEKFFIFIQ